MPCNKKLLLFLTVSALLSFTVCQAYAYNVKHETTSRFKLTDYNTYIYWSDTLYCDYAYVYSDKAVFTNVYMGSGETLTSLTISDLQSADMTINKLMQENEIKLTFSAASGTTSSVKLFLPSKPTLVKVEGIERLEGTGWTWSDTENRITLLPVHSSDVTISLFWTTTSNGGPTGGSTYIPPVTPPVTPPAPPYSPSITPTPTFQPTLRNLVLLGAVVVAVVLLISSATGEIDLTKSRKKWGGQRKKKRKKQPEWEKRDTWD